MKQTAPPLLRNEQGRGGVFVPLYIKKLNVHHSSYSID